MKPEPKQKPTRKMTIWKDQFIYRAYQLAREGLTDSQISTTLGVSKNSFDRWLQEKDALREAIADGRAKSDIAQDFIDTVYDRLSEELQDIWDRIEAVEPDIRDPLEVKRDKRRQRRGIDLQLRSLGKKHRQQLFLYALVTCNFSSSEAMRRCSLSPGTLTIWKSQDPDFAKLCEGIKDVKKDLYEASLVSLVKQGDSAATIFVNKTFNRDRGYSDKVLFDVQVNSGRDIDELGLSIQEKRLLLAKIRQLERAKGLPGPDDVIDVESKVVEKTDESSH